MMGDTGPLRPVLGDPLLRRRPGAPISRRSARSRRRRHRLDGDLEPRLHAVRARRRTAPLDAAARALDRHRRRPRARARGAPGRDVELRHRSARARSSSRGGDRPRSSTAPTIGDDDVSMRVIADHARAADVPHRRRRDAVERGARLRAPPRHAPRDPPRRPPRPGEGAFAKLCAHVIAADGRRTTPSSRGARR